MQEDMRRVQTSEPWEEGVGVLADLVILSALH